MNGNLLFSVTMLSSASGRDAQGQDPGEPPLCFSLAFNRLGALCLSPGREENRGQPHVGAQHL